MEIFLWIICFLPVGIFAILLGREMDKTAAIQAECLEIQRKANRDWDIRIKHARQLNDRLTEIYKSTRD